MQPSQQIPTCHHLCGWRLENVSTPTFFGLLSILSLINREIFVFLPLFYSQCHRSQYNQRWYVLDSYPNWQCASPPSQSVIAQPREINKNLFGNRDSEFVNHLWFIVETSVPPHVSHRDCKSILVARCFCSGRGSGNANECWQQEKSHSIRLS